MQSWDQVFEQKLLNVKDYRSFLKLFFEDDSDRKMPRKLSYQVFATRAGFGSKSYMADIIAARKRLTPSSFEKTVIGLKLSGRWAEYFRCLVAAEETDFCTSKNDKMFFIEKRESLKKKIEAKLQSDDQSGLSPIMEVLLQPHFPEIFAALGTTENGASLKDIMDRTQLTETILTKALDSLVSVNIVKHDVRTGRYLPIPSAIDGAQLNDEILFENDFLRSIQKMKSRFSSQSKGGESLFMTQTFSVKRNKMSEFKKRLAQIVTEFADDCENANGDAIGEICIGFTHNGKN